MIFKTVWSFFKGVPIIMELAEYQMQFQANLNSNYFSHLQSSSIISSHLSHGTSQDDRISLNSVWSLKSYINLCQIPV